MSLPSSLVVSQFRLVGGIRQDDPPTVGVFEPRAFLRRDDPGILFVLIDLLGEGPVDEALVGELMEVARRTYEQERGSTTRRLRQAVGAANQYLREWNRERASGRQAAGITCVTLVADEIYLAQAGPALAFITQPGASERFPAGSPWLNEEPLESMPAGIWAPLGVRDDVYVDLNFTQVGPGYTLFIAPAHLLQILSEDDVTLLLDQPPADALQDLETIAAGHAGHDLSALVASLLEPEPADVASAAEPADETNGPRLRRRAMITARRSMVTLASAGAAVLGGLATILEELLPERVGDEGMEPSEHRRQALMWLAFIIPLALGVLTLAMYWGMRGDRDAQFTNLIQSASDRAAQARALAETDPSQARELLLTASRELDRALNLRPEDVQTEQLRANVQSQLERLEGIVRLSDVTSVASLPGAIDDQRRLIVQGTSAYVLNRQEQVLHRAGLGDRRLVEVLRSSEPRGGQSVGPLVDMTWVPAGGVRDQNAVVVLDSTGIAWQINATGNVMPLRVTNAEDWRGLRLVGGFAGNLYLLDVGSGQILKYSPTSNGYTTPPVEWLSPEAGVDLENVVDMAIDGAIYLLQPNGRVEKLVAGEPTPFDQPDEFDLTQPITCFATPPAGAVFLADTTRILQFNTNGIYQRQLLPPEGEWEHLSALWVDEANGRLYAVDAGTLVMAPLP